MLTGSPPTKSISTYSGASGVFSTFWVSLNISVGGSAHGSSKMPPSKEMCSRFASMLYGLAALTGTGMLWRSANSINSLRPAGPHSRHGAMTLISGLRAYALISKRT